MKKRLLNEKTMTPVHKTLGVAAALVLAVAIFFHVRLGSSADPVVPIPPLSNATPSTGAGTVAVSMPRVPAADVHTASLKKVARLDWRAMDRQLKTAPNLRAVFYAALQKPEVGGYYQASQIRSLCRENLQMAQATLPAAQRQAVDDLARRCDFSLSELDDADRQYQAKRDLNYLDDPFFAGVFSYLMAQDDNARTGALAAAIDAGNPHVIGSILASTSNEAVAATPARDPQVMAADASAVILLVQCQLGADCTSAGSMTTSSLCIQHGWCADNVRDALRIGSGSDFGRLDQLAKQMTMDIRSGHFTPSPPMH